MGTKLRVVLHAAPGAVLWYLIGRFPGRFFEDLFMGWLQDRLAARGKELIPLMEFVLSALISWVLPLAVAIAIVWYFYLLGKREERTSFKRRFAEIAKTALKVALLLVALLIAGAVVWFGPGFSGLLVLFRTPLAIFFALVFLVLTGVLNWKWIWKILMGAKRKNKSRR